MKIEEPPPQPGSIQKSSSVVTVDLDSAATRTAVATRISEAIDAYSIEIYAEPFRWHLGASKIGDECSRKLWYSFRWVGAEQVSGRMYRLFQRGHNEEPLHAKYLKGIGFQVWTHDENGKQFRLERTCSGHFGGSLDGIVRFPESWNITEPALLSCKTNGTGAAFNKIKNDSLQLAKPEHFTQESVYGKGYGINYVVYLNTNKNDDDIAVKVEKLDFKLAEQMEIKAERIIFSQKPPPRLSENANLLACKSFCEFKEVCHFKKPAVKNCRSCSYCRPNNSGEFYCDYWNGQIPRAEVPVGCDNWQSITVGND